MRLTLENVRDTQRARHLRERLSQRVASLRHVLSGGRAFRRLGRKVSRISCIAEWGHHRTNFVGYGEPLTPSGTTSTLLK